MDRLFQSIVDTYVQMAPYLMLGLLFAGILHVVFKKETIIRYLGSNRLRAVLNAALIGVPLPLCSCGVVPTALSLRKNKASEGATMSFLISTPQTGVDSIIATYGMLGPVFAVFRPLAAFIMGIAGGVVMNLFSREDKVSANSQSSAFHCVLCMDTRPHSHSLTQKIRRVFTYAFGEFLDGISLHLVIGIAISGIVAFLVPADFFSRYVGNTFLEMLLMMIGGIPLYICATASIPIASMLMMKGLSAGAAFVFLATGPVTNAASLLLIYSEMGRRFTVIYLAVIAATSLLAGYALNWIGTFVPLHQMMSHANHVHMASGFSWKVVLTLIFSVPLVFSLYRLYFKAWFRRLSGAVSAPKTNAVAEKTFTVEGMTCKNCQKRVTEALYKVGGVLFAEVDLKNRTAKVRGTFKDEKIKDSVEKAGFSITG